MEIIFCYRKLFYKPQSLIIFLVAENEIKESRVCWQLQHKYEVILPFTTGSISAYRKLILLCQTLFFK